MLLSCGCVKGIPDPVYALISLSCINGYYVKAAILFSPVWVAGQIPRSRPAYFLLLLRRDGVCAAAMKTARPVLDFHEYNGGSVFHHQVNFTKTAGEIPVQ